MVYQQILIKIQMVSELKKESYSEDLPVVFHEGL